MKELQHTIILILSNAENNFKEAISIDIRFYEAYMMLGELMAKTEEVF